MSHGNESLGDRTDYRVIGFLGRPRIHATKRDECDDGCVILQTTNDFAIVCLQRKGNERVTSFLSKRLRTYSREVTRPAI